MATTLDRWIDSPPDAERIEVTGREYSILIQGRGIRSGRRALRLEDGPFRVVKPLTARGGKGSGHFGHEGREGEVGGSKPSGITNVADVDVATWDVETDNTVIGGDDDDRTWINDMAKKFASKLGILPAGVTFVLNDIAAYIELVYEGEVVRQGFRDEHPGASEDEIDQFILDQKANSVKLLSNVRGAFVGPESEASTNAIFFNTETISESSFMQSDYPQFGAHEGDPLYGSEARRTAVHELSHWIDEMTGGQGEFADQFLDEIPEAMLANLQQTAPTAIIASEYRGDLLAAYITSHDPSQPVFGRRHYFGDLEPESIKHLETLLERIGASMETKSFIFRGIANSSWVLIDGDEAGYGEAVLVDDDALTDEDRERFNVVPLVARGGKGSGHHGHEGRPGEVGGSQPSGRHPTPKPPKEGMVHLGGDIWFDIEEWGYETRKVDGVTIFYLPEYPEFADTVEKSLTFLEESLNIDISGGLKITYLTPMLIATFGDRIAKLRAAAAEEDPNSEISKWMETATDEDIFNRMHMNVTGGYIDDNNMIFLNTAELPKPGSKTFNNTLWHELAHRIDNVDNRGWNPPQADIHHGDSRLWGISRKYMERVGKGYGYGAALKGEYFADLVEAWVGSQMYEKQPQFSRRLGNRKLDPIEIEDMHHLIAYLEQDVSQEYPLTDRAGEGRVKVAFLSEDGTREILDVDRGELDELPDTVQILGSEEV